MLLWFNIVAHRCFNAHLLCQAPKSGGPGSFGSKKQVHARPVAESRKLHGHALLKTTCLQVKFFANGETSKSFDLIWFTYYTSHTSQGLCDILRWDAAHAAHGRGKRKEQENKGKANQERGESLSRRGVKLAFERMNNISVSCLTLKEQKRELSEHNQRN